MEIRMHIALLIRITTRRLQRIEIPGTVFLDLQDNNVVGFLIASVA